MSVSLLLWITGIVGFYMAWNIGANDVANAMGTSVGSRALSLRNAVIIAGLLEFAGAVLVGTYVVETVRKGIVDPVIFAHDPNMLISGMMAALAAAAIWLNVASFFGLPVSTTHSIVGAIAGFGLLIGGTAAINWSKLVFIVASWVVSPIIGGLVAFVLYSIVRVKIIETKAPVLAAHKHSPKLVAMLVAVLSLVTLLKGLKNLKLDLNWIESIGVSGALGVVAALGVLAFRYFRKVRDSSSSVGERQVGEGVETMERSFVPLQVATAASVAFAHGANDVANAVGPMAAVFAAIRSGVVEQKVDVPIWILLIGGLGIVLGLATYGYRVMGTIGTRITELTPSRGFAAEFGAAITILAGSKLGLPLSTTHTLVGAVIGVGFARGTRALDLRVVRSIVSSWLLTVPVAAVICIPLVYLLRWLLG